jgi:HSP20 family protein
MRVKDPYDWMWSEALDLLARAESMRRQAFQPRRAQFDQPCWEPPVDVFETEDEVVVITALPGVDPAEVSTILEEGALAIRGVRSVPPELRTSTIHRLELPQGCFQRRVEIPPGRYDEVARSARNGCVVVTLRKSPVR